MKERIIIFLSWCLLFCANTEVHGQIRGFKPQKLLIRVTKPGSNLPPRVWVFPGNTPQRRITQMAQNNGSEYRIYELSRSIKKGDVLKLHLDFLNHQEEYGLETTKQEIPYDEIGDNTVLFQFKKDRSLPSNLPEVNYSFRVTVNDDSRSILTDEIEADRYELPFDTEVKHHKKSLFENRDSLLFWKNQFVAFLNAHGNEFKDTNGIYLIDTSEDKENNKVTQAFASFLRIWLENKTVTGYSGPACWRFLTDDGRIGKSVIEDSWRNWFLNWFRSTYAYKADKELEDNIIHQKVKDWFAEKGLNRPTE